MEVQVTIALVIGTVVVLFVPALVWSTVIAGCTRSCETRFGKAGRLLSGGQQRAQSNRRG